MHVEWLRKTWVLVLFLIVVVLTGRFYLVPFVLWVQQNPDLAQSHAALAIAFLTLVLILITGYYAWTTRQTVTLLSKDLEYRTRPLIEIEFRLESFSYEEEQSGTHVEMTIKSSHAPARLLSAEGSYTSSVLVSDLEIEEPETFPIEVSGVIVGEGQTRTFDAYTGPEVANSNVWVSVHFEDMAGLRRYTQASSTWLGQGVPKFADEKEKTKPILPLPLSHRKKSLLRTLTQKISGIVRRNRT